MNSRQSSVNAPVPHSPHRPFFVNVQQSLDFSAISHISCTQMHDPFNLSQINVALNNDDADVWDLGQILEQVNVMNEIPEQNNESSVASTDEQTLDNARSLKKEVLALLESYANNIAQNQLRLVRRQIPEDSKRIGLKLEELRQGVQRSVKESKEVDTIVRLVQEFLNNFESLKLRAPNQRSHQQIECPRPVAQAVSYVSEELKPQRDPNRLLDSLNHKITKLTGELPQGDARIDSFKEMVLQFASSSDHVPLFTQLRTFSKDIDCRAAKKIVKACYIKCNLLNEESSYIRSKESTRGTVSSLNVTKDALKRKFYDFAVSLKFKLPKDHPAQKMMITQLYEMAILEEIAEEDWESFIIGQVN